MKYPLILAGFCCFLATSCSLTRGRIQSEGVTLTAPKDAGKGATLDKGETKTAFDVPPGTTITTTKTEATPSSPAKTVTEYNFTKPTRFEEIASTLKADTGTIDTSVANHKIDVASKAPLLWAALAALVAAAAMMYFEHPTAAMLCGAAAAIFFAAWKLADLPDWFWGVGVTAVAGGFALVFGHAKGVKNTIAAITNPAAK